MDVVDLRNFYAQRLGVVARRFVGRAIRTHWTDTTGQRVLGIGYATPYLGLFREEAERCLALMPAPQGVVRWPSSSRRLRLWSRKTTCRSPIRPSIACCSYMRSKNSTDPVGLLREVWRVLSGGGRLLAVVPNRRGLWARMDTTPFGHGRPYSRSQITHLLRETWFTPLDGARRSTCRRSHAAGFCARRSPGSVPGPRISAPFAGVHIVEATKQVYRAIPTRRERRRLVPLLPPVLAPTPGAAAAV